MAADQSGETGAAPCTSTSWVSASRSSPPPPQQQPVFSVVTIDLVEASYITKTLLTPKMTFSDILITATYSFKAADRQLYGSGWELALLREDRGLVWPDVQTRAHRAFAKERWSGEYYCWLGPREMLTAKFAEGLLVRRSAATAKLVPEVQNFMHENKETGDEERRLVNIHLAIEPPLLLKINISPFSTFADILDTAMAKCKTLRPKTSRKRWTVACRGIFDLNYYFPAQDGIVWFRFSNSSPGKFDVWVGEGEVIAKNVPVSDKRKHKDAVSRSLSLDDRRARRKSALGHSTDPNSSGANATSHPRNTRPMSLASDDAAAALEQLSKEKDNRRITLTSSHPSNTTTLQPVKRQQIERQQRARLARRRTQVLLSPSTIVDPVVHRCQSHLQDFNSVAANGKTIIQLLSAIVQSCSVDLERLAGTRYFLALQGALVDFAKTVSAFVAELNAKALTRATCEALIIRVFTVDTLRQMIFGTSVKPIAQVP